MTSVQVKLERFGPMTTGATTIKDIISKLRSSFTQLEFEAVTAILENRENQLNANVTDLKLQLETLGTLYTNLEKKHEELAVEKLQIEAQVKKYKTECEDYVEKYTVASEDLVKVEFNLKKVELDLRVVTDRDNRAREKSAKLMVEKTEEIERLVRENDRLGKEKENSLNDFEKERKEKKIEMIKLKEKFVGLIGEKTKAEESARVWGEKYNDLEARVKKMEENVWMITRMDPDMLKIVQQLDANAPSVINGNPESVGAQRQSNLSNCDVNNLALPGNVSIANLPTVDINGSHEAALVDGNLEVANPQRVNNSSPAAGSTHDLPRDDRIASRSSALVDGNLEVANPQRVNNSSPAAGSTHDLPRDDHIASRSSGTGFMNVIEIDDSEDEMHTTGIASASKTGNDNGRSNQMDPAPALSSKSKRPLDCSQINTGIDDVTQCRKRKRNATSPHMTKTEEVCDSSDESITDSYMEKLVTAVSAASKMA